LSKTGGFNTHGHAQHVDVYFISTKRGLEQPSATQPTKRPRLKPGAYVSKPIIIDDDESTISPDGIECSDGSEYCD
jgi:hypothetical protein